MGRPKSLQPDERDVIKALLAHFANVGRVDLSKPKSEVWDQFVAAANELDDEMDPVIDHTEELLASARRARKEDDYSLAVLMYATWVEHSLNLILFELAVDRKMLRAHFNGMIKEASLRAKSTWLLPLLGGKALSPSSVGRIQKLADARNAYIHYKWGQTYKEARADQGRALEEAEKLVKMLQRYKIVEAQLVSTRSKIIRNLVPR